MILEFSEMIYKKCHALTFSEKKQAMKCNEVRCNNKNCATKIEAVQVVIVVHQTDKLIHCGLQFISANSATW